MNALRSSFPTFMVLMTFVVTGCFSPAWSSEAVVIKGFPKAEVSGDQIYLGRICRVTGKDATQVRRIKGIRLGKAPLPGNTRRIDADYIRLRLRQAKVNPDGVRLQVSGAVEVSRASVTITREEIKRAVDNFIRAHVPWDKDRVIIRKIQVKTDVVLPKGNVSYRIEPLRNARYRGRIALPVHFSVDGLFQKRILATAEISLLSDVVVVRKSLRRHCRIREDDIEIREKDLSRIHSNVITDPEEVLGKRAKRSMAAGTILRSDLIEYPPLVRRGDVVVVVAETAGLRITALGVVKEREGRLGERIKIENLDSKKNIYARVLDSKTVEVDF